MKILVTGATGYIGGRLVPRLLEAGHRVRVMVRDRDRITGRPWAGDVEVAVGDVEVSASLKAACLGVDVAYYLVHLMDSGGDFADRDRAAAQNFVAAGAGLRRVIYLGGLLPAGEDVSRHLGSRAEVGEILRSGLPTVEFRAGPVIGSGSASFEMVRYLTERLPAMIAPRWILNQVQPIAVRDILSYLLAALEDGSEGVYDVGCDPLSFKEMMQVFARARGLQRLILPVPVLAPRLAALWVGLVTPIPNRLAVPLIEGVVHPVVGDDRRARRDFPEVDPISYEEAVERALGQIEKGVVATRWSGAVGSNRAFELEVGEGLIREVRRIDVAAPADRVFEAVSGLGGDRGWLVWNWAWRLRGLIDRLVGGPGLRRGRRSQSELLSGDALDFWRVVAIDRPRLLLLRAEMKVPGRAWLQWEIESDGERSRLIQSALFAPTGLAGKLYWDLMYPVHKMIFSSLVREIGKSAEGQR